jgi:hypothetical protein
LKRRPARHEHLQARRDREQFRHDRRRAGHPLETVQQQQDTFNGDVVPQNGGDAAFAGTGALTGAAGDAQGLRDRRQHERRILYRVEGDPEHPVLEVRQQVGARLKPETRFAGPSGPRQGQQAHVRPPQQALQFPQFRVTTEQRGRLGGQVVRAAVQGVERREVAGQIRGHQLVDPLRPYQIAQLALAAIAQFDPFRQSGAGPHAFGGAPGQQDLAAVSGVEQSGDAVQGRAEEIPVPLLGLARVDGHSHADRLTAAGGSAASAAPPAANVFRSARCP